MSGPLFVDDVRSTTATTSTGTLTVAAASGPYVGLSAVGDGNWGYWRAAGQSGTEWEVFAGTVGGSGTTLTRDSVLASSNAGALVNFSAGTKDVFMVAPANIVTFMFASCAYTMRDVLGGL